MKTKLLFTYILFCCSLQLFAQTNPLVGTWQMKSGDTLQSIKIITPTHWSLYTERLKAGGEKEFVRAIAGTYTMTGDKYVESLDLGSMEGMDKAKTDYTLKVTGDTFHQKGILTYGDYKINIDEKWQKVKLPAQSNPAIGTWNQLTSSGVDADGKKWSHTNATHSRYMVLTPTHYMLIRHKDNKFESALSGTYQMEGNKFKPNFEMSSTPTDNSRKIEIIQRMEGNKLIWDGVLTDKEGKHTWQDLFEKVNSKTAKTASNK